MGLETATYINDLISTNPTSTDVRSQGDDHIRTIKAAVKATFPNASKKFYFPQGSSTQTGTVTVADTDDNKVIPVSALTGARTVNLPQGSTLWDGFSVTIVKADHSNNAVTIDGYSAETVNGELTVSLWQRYQSMRLQYVSALSAWIAQIVYIPPIGEVTPWASKTAPTGWVLLNGGTIGDATSGASERANEDARGLFYHLWANYANAECAVLPSGRGASAQADFDAHKTIALPDARGRGWHGLDDMGGSAAGRIGNVITSDTTLGASGGSEEITMARANLPNVQPPITLTQTPHKHTVGTFASSGAGTSNPYGTGTGGAAPGGGSVDTSTTSITISASIESLNGGVTQTAMSNMPPVILGSWKIKL